MKIKTITAILLGAATLAAAPVLPVTRGIWQDNAVVAEAATTYITTGSANTSTVTYRLDTSNKQAYVYSATGKYGTLTIPATVSHNSVNYPIVGIDSYAFRNYTALLTLDLTSASKMTTLGGYAFTNSTISTVKLGAANMTIRENAFRDASKLQTVEFKKSSYTLTVEKNAFLYSGLRYFNFYGYKLNAKSYSFSRTNSLRNFYINSNTDSVTIETSAFAYSSINFLDAYCRSISIKSQAFEDALNTFSSSSLTYVDFNNSCKVINLADNAFSGLWSLRTVSFYNPSVSLTMGKSVFAASTVKTVNFPNSLTVIPESCFEYCTLTTMPLTGSVKEIRANAFAHATLPATVNIPASVTTIADTAFSNILDVKEFKFPNGNSKFKISGGGLYTSDLKRLVCYPPENTNTYVTIPAVTIPNGTIVNNSYIKSLNIQKYSRRSGDTMEFLSLPNVERIYVPSAEFNDNFMKNFSNLFGDNSKLVEVNGYRIVQQSQNNYPTFCSQIRSYIEANFEIYDQKKCEFMKEFNDKFAETVVRKNTSTTMSEIQKAMHLRKWIIDRADYDPDVIEYDRIKNDGGTPNPELNSMKNHVVSSVFLHKKNDGKYYTVCEGYALCYELLLRKAGINAYKVGGDNVEKTNRSGHAWNLIQIGGNWYHADITWDDNAYKDVSITNRYNNFMRTDAVFHSDDHRFYDYYALDDNTINKRRTKMLANIDNGWLGDLNGDQKCTIDDVNLLKNSYIGNTSATVIGRGDMNFDGKITQADVDLLSAYVNNDWKYYSNPRVYAFAKAEQ